MKSLKAFACWTAIAAAIYFGQLLLRIMYGVLMSPWAEPFRVMIKESPWIISIPLILIWMTVSHIFGKPKSESTTLEPKATPRNWLEIQDRLVESKNWMRLEQTARDWLVAEPSNYLAWQALGLAQISLREYAEAIASFKNAIQANSQDTLSWYGLGEALEKLGRYDDSITAHSRALALDPADVGTKQTIERLERKIHERAWGPG